MEILLKKLQEKGILSSDEATAIAAETKKAAEAEKQELKETATKASALPEWLKNTKFKGDLRLRYDAKDKQDDGRGTQGRGRFRLRAGAETAVNDEVTVGFGLASGTGNQRSANQTLGGIFTRKGIWIDYAYAKYAPVPWFSVMGGKFVNPISQPSDMLISPDVNPEGAVVKLEAPVASNLSLFLNGALFVLDDRNSASPSSTDPLMYVFQSGIKWNITNDVSFKFAPAYYGLSDLKNTAVLTATNAGLSNTNTAIGGKYKYNYSAINWGGELGWNKPFGISSIPYLGVMGGYIHNPDPSDNNSGYLVGFSVGYPDVKKFGDWALEYTFRRIEKDAWLDFLPEDNFYSGFTNVMGHRAKLLFGLAKNTALGLNVYDTWLLRKFNPASSLTIPAATRKQSSEERVVQADLIFKF